jgi:PAS domain S-box-containing protein
MVEQLGQPEILRVLHQVDIGFAVIELTGEMSFVNEGFAKLRGSSVQDLIGKNVLELEDGTDREFRRQIFSEFREGKREQFTNEIEILDDNGETHWISFEANLIRSSETGAPQYQFVIVQDISERVRAQKQAAQLKRDADRKLHESEERFRTLAETIPQIVFTTDSEGHINYVNGKWFELTGGNPHLPITSEQVRSAIHPNELQMVQAAWQTSCVTSTPFNLECRLKSRDGEYRWFLTRAMPLFDGSGHTIRWFGSCTDIDQQRRLADDLRAARERAERASRMKSHFLANMSHEIRTPLGAILGFTELLGDSGLDEEERLEFLGVIARNGRSLSRIVDDVLDLSKVEAGLLSLEKTPFCPRTLVSDIATLFSEKARRKGIKLESETAENLPESVVSDPSRIRQIVSNLVSNAVKFTQTGSVKLRVTSSDKDVCFIVQDTGIGIGPQHLNNLFQPFVQGDESLSRKHGGTGLGLYLSRKLAEALGGTLEISHTEENSGTTITLTLPIQLGSVQAANEWKHDNHGFCGLKTGLKDVSVLVVDDAADNRLLIERMLSKSGAKVSFAVDGLDGIDRAIQGKFDVILMDLQMPDVDGFEATEKIRAKGIKTPIVALTAHAVDEIRDRCERAGFNGFLTKPVDSKSLLTITLDLALKRKESKPEAAGPYIQSETHM